MTRKLGDWLTAYVEFASISEAPLLYHFWSGVAAMSGALRRHVWFDQIQFQWYCGFYLVFVAKPGVATKSTATGNAMNLLKAIPDIHFGPDEVTWQQLVTSFANSRQSFQIGDMYYPQSAITIFASEFGMLMDFKETKFVNLLITMWDGLRGFRKETKRSGTDEVEAPFVSLIAATTPQWIDANMDANTIGGGFTSRCIFVYADKKAKRVAHIKTAISRSGFKSREEYEERLRDLVHDLEHISMNLLGEYTMTPEAEAWGEAWYEKVCDEMERGDNPDYISNYLSRKQAHLYKLAMILAAARRDDMLIHLEDLQLALTMLDATEADFKKVFSRVGRSEESIEADKLLNLIRGKGEMPYKEVYKMSRVYWPNGRDFEGVLASFIKAEQVRFYVSPGDGVPTIKYIGG